VDYPPFRALYTANGAINDHGYALNSHPNITSGPHNDEYDFATAPALKVPGDWNTQVPQLFAYEGVVFYERDFKAEPKPGTRTFLHIGAANYRSHVWANHKRVCDHEGGFTRLIVNSPRSFIQAPISLSSASTQPACKMAFPR